MKTERMVRRFAIGIFCFWALMGTDSAFGQRVPNEAGETAAAEQDESTVLKAGDWSKRYDGTSNGWDYGQCVGVDAAGNVYVSGASTGDYSTFGTFDVLLLSYTAQGNQRWVRLFDGPGRDTDKPYAMQVDAAGNIYLTGETQKDAMPDYLTAKYNNKGKTLWVKQYNGNYDWADVGRAIAVDPAGNVAVTGVSSGSNLDTNDMATVKYTKPGKLQWVQRYNGKLSKNDAATAIATDKYGNVYVTGGTEEKGTGWDFLTFKYDRNGKALWSRLYNGVGTGNDEASAVAVDDAGNVYVTGLSFGEGTSWDFLTLKYSPKGDLLWAKRYDGPANGEDMPWKIGLDKQANVYVGGYSIGATGNYDYLTLKYSTDGKLLWQKRYDGPVQGEDKAHGMVVDGDGNVVVTGGSEGYGTDFDYATVMYDKDGNQKWVKRYNGSANMRDIAYDVAVDRSGNVYVTGESFGPNFSIDCVTVKYAKR